MDKYLKRKNDVSKKMKYTEENLEKKITLNENNNESNFKNKTIREKNLEKKSKLVLYILTRDFRTEDNLTLYEAYEESIKSNSSLCVIFRFHPDQINQERNRFYCSFAVQFMIESLELLSEKINFNYIDPIEDDEFAEYLSKLPIHKIFIMRDYTPFARKRFEFLNSLADTEEVDDVTVYPVEEMGVFNKLAYFINNAKTLKFRQPKHLDLNWKSVTTFLNEFYPANFIYKGKCRTPYEENRSILVRPVNLDKYLSKLSQNLKGYSVKKIREQVGTPKVSLLSAFIKFGLISIRSIHYILKNLNGISNDDKLAFERELYFRDFFYKLAWSKPEDVFVKSNWQGSQPKFTSEEDLLEFKRQRGMKLIISKDEFKEIEEAKEIYRRFQNAETEYPLINASIMQLKTTGYMLNRTRMLVASYLSQDNGLWWKYAEQFYANYLTEYDWTINSLNHQNIAKVGLYPKYTQNFSIKRQESTNPKDKQEYIQRFLKK